MRPSSTATPRTWALSNWLPLQRKPQQKQDSGTRQHALSVSLSSRKRHLRLGTSFWFCCKPFSPSRIFFRARCCYWLFITTFYIDISGNFRNALVNTCMKAGGKLPVREACRLRTTASENNSGLRSFLYVGSGTILRCTGIAGYCLLVVTTKSYIHFFPGTHCPPTSGVVQTFLTGMVVYWLGGVPCHCTGPTMVLSLVLRTASITDAAESGFCARLNASSATSNRE